MPFGKKIYNPAIPRPGASIKKTNITSNNMTLVTEQQEIRTFFSDTNENVEETIVGCNAAALRFFCSKIPTKCTKMLLQEQEKHKSSIPVYI